MTVVETPFFVRKADGLVSDEERERLIAFIAANPEAGDVIPESGGIRKLRWAARGKGKSGGVRKAERNEFRTIIPLLAKTYVKGRCQ